MEAAEDDFDLEGHHLRAGAFIIRDGADAKVRASIQELGLTAYATSSPTVKNSPTHHSAHRLRPLLAAHAGRGLGPRRA
ncbi:MAG: hypothetical protein WDN23_06585 [Edaphobacter sp.]